MKITAKLGIMAIVAAAITTSSCSDSTSYADLLNDETKYINNYLADQRVEGSVPADSVFEIGPDAPYYRMDEDGDVYMQVIKQGDMNNRPQYNDLVYLRLTRYDLQEYVDGELPVGAGNAYNVGNAITIRYQNESSQSYTTWGEGIQVPLQYLGYNCEVNIVVRSRKGPYDEISVVTPYLYNIRYFKSNI